MTVYIQWYSVSVSDIQQRGQKGFKSRHWLALCQAWACLENMTRKGCPSWVLASYDSSPSSSLQGTACCPQTNEKCVYCFDFAPSHHSFPQLKISQQTVRGGREHTFVEVWLGSRCWVLGHTDELSWVLVHSAHSGKGERDIINIHCSHTCIWKNIIFLYIHP